MPEITDADIREKRMFEERIAVIEEEVREYIELNPTQAAIQAARSELRLHRLGRLPLGGWDTDGWEQQQAITVQIADRLLKDALSGTLELNRKASNKWRRGR